MNRWFFLLIVTGFLLLYPGSFARGQVTGPPDITTKVPIPNTIKFGETGTDADGNTFLKSFVQFVSRDPSGFVGFQGSSQNKPVVDIPAVYEELGTQLDLAQPFLTPDAIDVQKIRHPFTFSTTGTLCFASDNENTQAFPIRERIITNAPKYAELLRGSAYFAGLLAPNVTLEKTVYEHLDELYPNVLAEIAKKPECDEPPPSRSVRRDRLPATEAHLYEVPEEKRPLYILERWISSLPVVGELCSKTNCNLSASPPMNVHLKNLSPYIREIMKNTTNDPASHDNKRVGFLPTFIPEAFQFPNEHGNVPNQTIEQSVGTNSDPINDVKFNYFGSRTIEKNTQFTNCSLFPDSIQSKNLSYDCNFSDAYGQPAINPGALGSMTSGAGATGHDPTNNPLTYRIPYRNTSCQVSSTTIGGAMDVMTRYYPSYAAEGTRNLARMWQEIQAESVRAGWNPAFALTLWIEESAAGGAPGAYGMGCIYHTYANGARMTLPCGSDEATREQYQCLFERSFSEDFNKLMCTYSGEQRDSDGHCTNFANNPNFIHNVRWWYDLLSQGMQESCRANTP